MEEVDSIILHFLRRLNVTIKDEIRNLCDLSVEDIIESVSKCLTAINKSLKTPIKLPSSISQRIEVAAQIASCCKDLGYKNDVGYQTFLYYNEAELRQVFMFLIEKLPNEGKQKLTTPPANKTCLLMQNIGNKIKEELSSVWIPPSCKSHSINKIGDYIYPLETFSFAVSTVADEDLNKKLEILNNIKANYPKDKVETQVKVNKEVDNENTGIYMTKKNLKELKETSILLRQKLDSVESDKNVMDVEYLQALKSSERVEADLINIENILRNFGISNIENPVDDILEKIQKDIVTLHGQSEEMTSKNLFLKAELDKLRSSVTETEKNKCKKQLIFLKESAKSLKEEYEKQEEMKNRLKIEFEKLRGGNRRSIYTKRILEIISNIDKQNMEIKKILEDTRHIQKEINTLEGQLERSFLIADETLFGDAKKDDQAKKAYKLLALLHSECNTIVSLVNDTGILARDIVDLEDNIKAEKAKRTEDTLRKIEADLNRIHNE